MNLAVVLHKGNGDGKGTAIEGQTVDFTLDGATYSATTDSTGGANTAAYAPATPGTYPITASFPGANGYRPAAVVATLLVRYGATLNLLSTDHGDHDSPYTFQAQLTVGGAGTDPIVGRTVTFTLGDASYDAVTDAAGIASVNVTTPSTPGAYASSYVFAGDGSMPVRTAVTARSKSPKRVTSRATEERQARSRAVRRRAHSRHQRPEARRRSSTRASRRASARPSFAVVPPTAERAASSCCG